MTKNRKAIIGIGIIGAIILFFIAFFYLLPLLDQGNKTYNVNFLENLTLEQMINAKEEGIPLENGTILEPKTSEDRRTLLIITRLVETKTETFIPFEYGEYVSKRELEKRVEVLKDKVPGRSLNIVTENGKKGVEILLEEDTGNYSKLFLSKCSNEDFEEASKEEGINSTLPATEEDDKILEVIISCNEGNSFVLLQNEENSIAEEDIQKKLEIINQKFNKHYMSIGEKMIDASDEKMEIQKVILIQ